MSLVSGNSKIIQEMLQAWGLQSDHITKLVITFTPSDLVTANVWTGDVDVEFALLEEDIEYLIKHFVLAEREDSDG